MGNLLEHLKYISRLIASLDTLIYMATVAGFWTLLDLLLQRLHRCIGAEWRGL